MEDIQEKENFLNEEADKFFEAVSDKYLAIINDIIMIYDDNIGYFREFDEIGKKPAILH